jgi:hypothetical protein
MNETTNQGGQKVNTTSPHAYCTEEIAKEFGLDKLPKSLVTIIPEKKKRKFSQSCNSKQDFIDLLVELRDKAEKKQYDPENTFSKEYQDGFADGQWSLLCNLIRELVK